MTLRFAVLLLAALLAPAASASQARIDAPSLVDPAAIFFLVAPPNTVTPPPPPTQYNQIAYTCTRNIYVETPGNGGLDSNNGLTQGTPIATIQHYNDALTPVGGDCVQVGPGTFVGWTATHSGTANTVGGYVVVKSRIAPSTGSKGRLATWQTSIVPAAAGSFNTIDLAGAAGTHDYWIIDGLDIKGPPNDSGGGGNAVEFETGHHFQLMNSNIHDAASSGFVCFTSDYCGVFNNNIYNVAWFNASANSGISFFQLAAFDAVAGFHNVVSRNLIEFASEGPAITSTGAHTDGNCLIMDSLATVGYAPSTLIDDNVLVRCGGVGLHLFYSNHIWAMNNGSYGNLTDKRLNGTNNGIIDNYGNGVHDNHFCNNWSVHDGAYNSANFAILDNGGGGSNSAITYNNNITFNGTAGQASVLITNGSTASIVNGVNGNQLGVNPKITAPSTDLAQADWHLQGGSVGLGTGSTTACGTPQALDFYGAPRVVSGLIDIGPTQGSAAPTWTEAGSSDDMWFEEQLFSDAGGPIGQGLLSSNTSFTGATDLLPNSPTGYPYMQYTGTQIRLAYRAPVAGLGLLDEPPGTTNFLLNSAVPATQTTGSLATGAYVLWGNMEASGGFPTAGSLVLSNGTATGCVGTATQGAPVTFTITVAGTCTVTKTGQVYFEQLENVVNGGTVQGLAGTSGIVTAGATQSRASDWYMLAGSAKTNSLATPASMHFRGAGSSRSGANQPYMLVGDTSFGMIRGTSSTTLTATSTSNVALTATLGTGTVFGPVTAALGWDITGRSLVANQGVLVTDTTVMGTSFTNIGLGNDPPPDGNAYGGLVQRFADYNSRLSDSALAGLVGGTTGGGGGGGGPPAVGFNFTLDFSAVADGTPFQTWNGVEQSVINNAAIASQWNNDFQSSANHMWFVAVNKCGRNKHLLESLYPANGTGQQMSGSTGYGYQNAIIVTFRDTSTDPKDVLNISFDMCLDSNYWLGSLSKFVMHLGYGDLNDFTQATQSRTGFGYECHPLPPPDYTVPPNLGCNNPALGSYNPPSFWWDYSIQGGDGAYSKPVDGPVATTGAWHTFKFQLARGASGYVNEYMDGALMFNHAVTNICNPSFQAANPGCTTNLSTPFVMMSTWFGGGSSVYRPPVNAIAYFDNIRMWSGTGP